MVIYLRTATTSKKAFDMVGDAFHVAIGHFAKATGLWHTTPPAVTPRS
ncbi:MAG: hypothetical protein ACRDJU_09555 [Actinomycetota bacterium]